MAKMTGGGRLGTVSVIFLDDTEDALSWSTIHFLRTSWCMNGKGGDNLSPPFREFRVALLHLLRHTPVLMSHCCAFADSMADLQILWKNSVI